MQTERILQERTTTISNPQSIIYWMRCEHRAKDNWALLYALEQANSQNLPLLVLFCLSGSTPASSYRQKHFLYTGIQETQRTLEKKNIPFINSTANTPEQLATVVKHYSPKMLITDHSALKPQKHWLETIINLTECAVATVDGRNVVPARYVSEKQEYAARTIRPKIHRSLDLFLTQFPALTSPAASWNGKPKGQPLSAPLSSASSSSPVTHIKSGEKAAHAALQHFLTKTIQHYEDRNDPTQDALSNLSPYLHFGMLSAQRIVLETLQHKHIKHEAKEVFLEELVVRRELADNFCIYNQNYDSIAGFPQWAQDTLQKHLSDPRDYIYTLPQFEHAQTHDPLWNAAQQELTHLGKMHGYMRMYWAKKILEWTHSPEDAMNIALHLNDTYSLDGVDSNGYTGIAWSIGGVHDRPWRERPIFGTVRYMNYNGAKRKFNVEAYIEKVRHAAGLQPA